MLKKIYLNILGIIMFCIGLFGLTHAQTCDIPNVTDKQQKTMSKIYTIFDTYQDVIEARFPGTNFMVTIYLEELGKLLNCSEEVQNYKEFETGTIYLLQTINTYDENTAHNEAITYNDIIVDIQSQALDSYDEYDTIIINTNIGENFEPCKTKRIETLNTIKSLQNELKKMGGFYGDTMLRDAFINNLESLVISLENEEKELLDLYISRANIEGDIPTSEAAKEEALLNSIHTRDDAAYAEIIKIQEAFAAKYNYDIEE